MAKGGQEQQQNTNAPTRKPFKGLRIKLPGHGVKLHYLFYWRDVFRHPEVERSRVPIRYDPFNIAVAYAYVRG